MPSVRRASASRAWTFAVWRAFQARCASGERQEHPVQAGEPERRNGDGDREAAVVAVAEAEQRQHVLPLRAADPDLAVEPHQRVDASAAARRACADPVRPPRVGDVVAEGEGGAVLQRLVPLADDAEHGAACRCGRWRRGAAPWRARSGGRPRRSRAPPRAGTARPSSRDRRRRSSTPRLEPRSDRRFARRRPIRRASARARADARPRRSRSRVGRWSAWSLLLSCSGG